jgi:chromosomal replication initiation ATPase DnaA
MTMLDIAIILGKSDHSTIIHGLKRMGEYMCVYPEFREQYKLLHLNVYHTLKHYRYLHLEKQ